jgi:hypothetical protein
LYTLRAAVKEAIRSVLPYLAEEKLDEVVEQLFENGLGSVDDLRYVRTEHFKGVLLPIPITKLMDAWKPAGKKIMHKYFIDKIIFKIFMFQNHRQCQEELIPTQYSQVHLIHVSVDWLIKLFI